MSKAQMTFRLHIPFVPSKVSYFVFKPNPIDIVSKFFSFQPKRFKILWEQGKSDRKSSMSLKAEEELLARIKPGLHHFHSELAILMGAISYWNSLSRITPLCVMYSQQYKCDLHHYKFFHFPYNSILR